MQPYFYYLRLCKKRIIMKKHLLFIFIIVSSCCSKPAPEKVTNLQLNLTSRKDSTFFKNITKIYAMGSNINSSRFSQNPKSYQGSVSYYLELPISYAFDSTVYIFENKVQKNDTVVVHYKRNVSYDGANNCGYQQTLSSSTKQHYSSLNKYKLEVSFGTYGFNKGLSSSSDYACTIKLYEK
jgi:hypothetical protein